MPRGKHLSLDCLKAVRAAYDEAISEKKERPGALESVGADKLMGYIPFKVGRSALTKVVKHFKNGGTAKEYWEKKKENKKNCGKKAIGQEKIDTIAKCLKEDSGSATNSQRKMAEKAGCSRASVQKVLKFVLKKKPLRKVITTNNCQKTLATRQKVAAELTASLESGEMDIDAAFFSDETWVDVGAPYRVNSKNDVVYVDADEKKADAMDQLQVGKKQKYPGIMLHLTVSSMNGGVMLEPYFYGAGAHVTGEAYSALLGGTIFRQIEAITLGAPFWFQRDLATSHTAKITKNLIAAEKNVKMVKWLPAGADLNPLDVYVNDAVKNALKGKDLPTIAALKQETAIAIARLRPDRAFLDIVAKTRRAFPKRVAWVAANGGRKVNRSKVREMGE